MIANEMVDFGGVTYTFRLGRGDRCDRDDTVRAFAAVAEIFGLQESGHGSVTEDTTSVYVTSSNWRRNAHWNGPPAGCSLIVRSRRHRCGYQPVSGGGACTRARVPGWLRGQHVATLTGQAADSSPTVRRWISPPRSSG